MKGFLISLVAVIIILSFVVGGLVEYDILQDRQYTVVTVGSVPAYPNWEPYPSENMKSIFVLPAKTIAKVKRIRNGKNYTAIRVQSEKGDMGWIFNDDSEKRGQFNLIKKLDSRPGRE